MEVKTIKVVATEPNKYLKPVHIFESSVDWEFYDKSSKFLTGGFYREVPISEFVVYLSDQQGNILDAQPVFMESGLNTFREVFAEQGFTLIGG
jgi:hypothetical protein